MPGLGAGQRWPCLYGSRHWSDETFDRHPIVPEFVIFIVAALPSAKIAKSRTTRPLQSI